MPPLISIPLTVPPSLTKRIMQGWQSSLINAIIISDVRTGLRKACSESLCPRAVR